MSNQSSLVLIPASNFEIRNLAGVKLKVSQTDYILLSGWGIYDKLASAYVRFSDTKIKVLGQRRYVEAPYTLKSRKAATEAMSQGLYEGYLTISI